MRLVYGVGVNDGKYKSLINRVRVKEYCFWSSMITRCYSEKAWEVNPAYRECEVSENFKSYSYFYEWCQDKKGVHEESWQLDKDLLIKGNKIYSEDTCVFLPNEINSLLIKRKERRGEYPIGVAYRKGWGKFVAQMGINGRNHNMGSFNTIDEAFARYKECKEERIKSIARKYADRIDKNAFDALMSYEVLITD